MPGGLLMCGMERHRTDFSDAASIIAGHADPLPHPCTLRRRQVRSAFDDFVQQRIFLEQRFVDCDAETPVARHVDVVNNIHILLQ
jgi:hypothetical protein